ncbi:hypothetical protein Bbelb_124510 [Branchiostoma belcheri]|nr:hypothetical protein Bbelb_124510 [Branchiostoma belcheri]
MPYVRGLDPAPVRAAGDVSQWLVTRRHRMTECLRAAAMMPTFGPLKTYQLPAPFHKYTPVTRPRAWEAREYVSFGEGDSTNKVVNISMKMTRIHGKAPPISARLGPTSSNPRQPPVRLSQSEADLATIDLKER